MTDSVVKSMDSEFNALSQELNSGQHWKARICAFGNIRRHGIEHAKGAFRFGA